MTSELRPPPGAAGGAELSDFGYAAQLRRSLSLGDLLVYGLVFIVPIAPFGIFGIVFNASKGMVPLTYLIGLVAMVFTALSYRQMSEAFPIAGSVYAYAGRGLHPSAGFLAGWAILLDYLLVPTLCYVVGAAAMRAVVPSIPQSAWIIGFVVFNTAVNALGIETTARTSRIFLIGSALAGGSAFKLVIAVSLALAAAIANALVAQAATARLLFAMARDGQLPRFLAHVHPVRRVPERAVLFVAVVSLILGLFFVGQVGLLSSLVNFGALFSLLMLHVSVTVFFLVKQRGRTFIAHLMSPAIGFVIIAFVLVNADIHAKVGGLVWLTIGTVVLIGLRLAGRSTDLNLEA